MAETNPITQIHDAIWALLEANSGFTALVPSINRIKYSDGPRDPIKHRAAPRDFPQVRVIPIGTLRDGVQFTSSHRTLVKTFAIQVATGDKRHDYFLTDVEWEVFRSLEGWRTPFEALTWASCHFVKDVSLGQEQDTLSETEMSRDDSGWTSVWEAHVTMTFPTSILIPETE